MDSRSRSPRRSARRAPAPTDGGTPLGASQRRLKLAERASLRRLQDIYKAVDGGALPGSPLKRAALDGLGDVARMRVRHSARYYGAVDAGHARWAALLEAARRETEDFLQGHAALTFCATATVLGGYTAPESPAKLPPRRILFADDPPTF